MNKQQLGSLAFVIVFALSASFCAGTIRDRVRTSALTVGEVALQIDSLERTIAAAQPPIYKSPAQQQQVGAKVLIVLEAARSYERAVRLWPASAPTMPRDVWEAQTAALKAIADVEGVLADLPGVDRLRDKLKMLREKLGG